MLREATREIVRTWAALTLLLAVIVLAIGWKIGFDSGHLTGLLVLAALVELLITNRCIRRWGRLARYRASMWWR